VAGDDASTADRGRQPRRPSLLDAVLSVVVLIVLIAITIWLFGVSATDGPLQAGRAGCVGHMLEQREPGLTSRAIDRFPSQAADL
jgi:hypothetical protein